MAKRKSAHRKVLSAKAVQQIKRLLDGHYLAHGYTIKKRKSRRRRKAFWTL